MHKLALPLLALVVVVLFAQPVFAGIGVSPGEVQFQDMMRAGYAERYVTVSNPGSGSLIVWGGVDGEISSWVSFEPANFTLGPGAIAIVKIIARTPVDIPNGVYKGITLITAKPATAATITQGAGAVTVSAVGITTTVTITDIQRLEFKLDSISAPDTEECRPINVILATRNNGNVKVSPRFHFDVWSADEKTLLQQYDWTGQELLATQVATLIARIPYEVAQYHCIPVGSYVIKMSAFAGDIQVAQGDIPFQIVPRGTLTVAGDLTKLDVKPIAFLGEVVRIDADFKNTGQLPVTAKLKAEVYKGNQLVAAEESDAKEFNMGESGQLSAFWKPGLWGDYVVSASAIFEGKNTTARQATVSVKIPDMYLWGGAAVIAVIILLAIVFIMRRRR